MRRDLRTRIRNLARSQARWAQLTGTTPEHVTRVLAGKYAAPEWWLVVLELLEALPRKDWPERWSDEGPGRHSS